MLHHASVMSDLAISCAVTCCRIPKVAEASQKEWSELKGQWAKRSDLHLTEVHAAGVSLCVCTTVEYEVLMKLNTASCGL